MFSSAAGPFQQKYPQNSTAQTPFQRLKPACVELLSLTGRTTAPAQSQQVLACLRRLKTTLQALLSDSSAGYADSTEPVAFSSKLVPADAEPVLSASLINFVFYPLSELISTALKGITSLPDSVAEALLDVLALLCSQWWMAWASPSESAAQAVNTHWQVWCDLVILSNSILGSPSSKDSNDTGIKPKASDEVKLAALRVLGELLSPRFKAHSKSDDGKPAGKAKEAEWEWDGVSDLPLLDDQDDTTDAYHRSTSTRKDQASPERNLTLTYPIQAHVIYAATDRVAKGAISFVLSSCFAVAESSQESTDTRSASISVARHALLVWIGGTCPFPPATTQQHGAETVEVEVPSLHFIELSASPSPGSGSSRDTAQLAAARRLRPLLPGLTSSLTRLATSRVKSKQGSKQKPTPSVVAAGAIHLLGDLLRVTLSDESLDDVLAQQLPLTQSRMTGVEPSVKVTDLEDFADAEIDQDPAPASASIEPSDGHESMDENPNEGAASKDAQWALSTLAQVHLALKTFSPLTQPSLPGTSLPSAVHASVQTAMLRLAVRLLSDCARSFAWLDQQLDSMARLDMTGANKNNRSGSQSSITTLLCWIIDLASEYNSKSVAQKARAAFGAVQKRAADRSQGNDSEVLGWLSSGAVLWSVLMQALNGLPATIASHNDEGASRLALRISTVLSLLQHKHNTTMVGGSALVGLAKLSRDMQDTCVRLLRPLKIDRLEYVEESADLPGSTTWRLQPVFSGLEASTSTQLSLMFLNIGRSLALSLVQELKHNHGKVKIDTSEVFALIAFLVDRATRLRSVRLDPALDQDPGSRSESLTSLVVAADLLRGVSNCLDNLELGLQFADVAGAGAGQASKQARKAAHRLGKKVFAAVMDMLDGDAEEAVRSRADASSSTLGVKQSDEYTPASTAGYEISSSGSTDQLLVERVKGISLASDDIDSSTPDRHGPALDLGFVRAANLSKSRSAPNQTSTQLAIQHRFQQAERNINLSNALLFALLGSSSKLLGQSFRSLLLRGSYPLISGMSASSSGSSELVRRASASAMKDVVFYTAYADVKNCLLDHADYILGSACQRLISGLDEELRAIALADVPVGSGSTVSKRSGDGAVHGMVVLPLISAQRAPFVLVEMIRVLGSEIIPMVEDAIDEILDALDRFHHHPTICDGLLAVLDSILETMAMEQASKPAQPASKKVDQIASVAHELKRDEVDIFKTWLAARRREQPAFDAAANDEQSGKGEEEKEDKPTKSQQVASQILSKAAMFLTHPSPILRTRVLGLLRHGIETLAPQSRTAELLPIVNSAWPFVMTRLGTSYSNAKGSRSSQLVPIIDLAPAAVGAKGRAKDGAWYRKVEASLVERDPGVWVAAARFVEAAVEHVPEFVGKRVVDEAWPRFELLLTLIRWKFDPRMMRRDTRPSVSTSKTLLDSETSSDGVIRKLISDPHRPVTQRTPTAHTHTEPPFIIPSTNSVPGQLTLCILTTLTSVVHFLGARMPDDAAWAITTHRSLLGMLDARQPPAVLKAAEGLFVELGKRNPEATTWAIKAAFPSAAESGVTPCFMRYAGSQVHMETVFHVLSCFT
ncbi:uncharacterized protein SPSC_04733 [Sporisorium scitamineum]|uniref:TTI1 C-terminal TPR domain-containing protein n=1 Tax=Sporisorium scitamineum TaxID=49012 RepID=A0A0F7S5U3_9BASI|nr:uncharacterized protein SPSC_04733 [Sporisorium scitamineum]CDW93728.1 hypothetical protein [Sporisorium scitamineum]